MNLMSILDKLSKIVHINLSKLKKLGNIHILSDNQHESITYNDNRKTLIINIGKLEKKELPRLQSAIKEFEARGDLLIEATAQKTLEDFKQVDSHAENRTLLEYFKGKLPARDIEILRASFYLKTVYERGDPVSHLKQDIINRYGERGRNISNLCTAEYFTSQIKPLYDEMYSQPNFSPDEFLKIYEIIVTESPYAIFINTMMSQGDVKREVHNKIEIDKKYGIRYLNIHGIGKDNVEKITYLLKELTPKLALPPEITRDASEKFIVVKIWF